MPSPWRCESITPKLSGSRRIHKWNQFFKAIITERLLAAIKEKSLHSTIFFFGCGSLVTSAESAGILMDLVDLYAFFYPCNHCLIPRRHAISHCWAFGAKRFVPALAASFVRAYVQCTLINGFHLHSVLKKLLENSLLLGHHSAIYHFGEEAAWTTRVDDERGKFLGFESWYNFRLVMTNKARPWGAVLPVTCPQCRTIESLQTKLGFSATDPALIKCQNCGLEMKVDALQNPVLIHKTVDGIWFLQRESDWSNPEIRVGGA